MSENEYYWAGASAELRKELRATLDQDAIKTLHRKQTWRHLLTAVRQFFFLGLSTWLLARYSNPLVVIPAALLSGFTVFNFTVLLHEQLHNLVFANHHPYFNSFLGQLYAFWSGISCSQFTRWHLDHHVQLGSETADPKRHHLSPKRNRRLVKLLYFTPVLFVIYFRAAARENATYRPELRNKIARERIVSIGGHLALQALLLWFGGPWVWLRAYMLPVFFVFPVAFAINRIGQHYNVKEDDPAGWTTWVKGSWFWDFIFINSNYHLEHHYYPGVPFYNLPRLQRILAPLYERHGMTPHSYGDLLFGYIIANNAPHTDWDFA
ncbi:MAG TPA: fatty acid desaturase [Candidatus Glassbacteria bacterium]|nr:fatty acid desaturase [Candidatus Glassbacteria bacterium]